MSENGPIKVPFNKMLSGAYSKQFKYLETQKIENLKAVVETEKADSLARAKRLTQETNKRRRAQAIKRRQEKDREEKRRQEILQQRREQQKEATERYQRSHVCSRPSSCHSGRHRGRTSPKRTLDETLRLVRGSLLSQNGHSSNSPGLQPHRDPLNKPYINKYSSQRAASAHVEHTHDNNGRHPDSRNSLHDKSLRNLSSSKNLFEQQLEHQQQLLIEQRRRVVDEFLQEVDIGVNHESKENIQDEVDSDSTSLSSNDSLEGSQDSLEDDGTNPIANVDKNLDKVMGIVSDGHSHQIHANASGSRGSVPPLELNQTSNLNETFEVEQKVSENDYKKTEEKIDSYNINQINYAQPKSKPESRPKVHVRAWATPSPEQGPMVVSVPSTVASMTTKTHPHTVRSTLTSVTTTTAYNKGQTDNNLGYVQCNAWLDEGSNLQQQYSSYSGSNTGSTSNKPPSPKNPVSLNTAKTFDAMSNAELLNVSVCLTNSKPMFVPSPPTVPKQVNINRSSAAMVGNYHVAGSGIQTSVIMATPISNFSGKYTESNVNINGTQTLNATPSKLPRPVSAVRVTNIQETKTVSPSTKTTANSSSNNTNPSTVSFGFVHGKMAVLPDHPSVQLKHVTGLVENYPNNIKAKDDSEVMMNTTNVNRNVKGILKRPGMGGGILKKAGSTGSMNNRSNELRDSLEIRRGQLTHHDHSSQPTPPKKKSVRWAEENDYTEYGVPDETNQHEPMTLLTMKKLGFNIQKRPMSAKAVMQGNHTEVTSKPPRAASAGSQRPYMNGHKSTIRPQAAAHIIHNPSGAVQVNGQDLMLTKDIPVDTYSNSNNVINKSASFNAAKSSYPQPVSEVTVYSVSGSRVNGANTYTSTVQNSAQLNTTYPAPSGSPPGMTNGQYSEGPVYDETGMRIDRTPTDDEINFLWDKVRTCLNRNPTTGSTTIVESPKSINTNDQQPLARQAAPVARTYIDGTSLGQFNGTNTRLASNGNSQYINGQQNANRRSGLLQQRKQYNPNSLSKTPNQREFVTYHGPVHSATEPQMGNNNIPPDASESIAAFLVAEQLTQQDQSVSDSQITQAMDEAQRQQYLVNAAKPSTKVPSALSIEEKRILESLDRLNEKLRISEFPGPLPSPVSQSPVSQNQPQYVYENMDLQGAEISGSFKGSRPRSARSGPVLRPTNIKF